MTQKIKDLLGEPNLVSVKTELGKSYLFDHEYDYTKEELVFKAVPLENFEEFMLALSEGVVRVDEVIIGRPIIEYTKKGILTTPFIYKLNGIFIVGSEITVKVTS